MNLFRKISSGLLVLGFAFIAIVLPALAAGTLDQSNTVEDALIRTGGVNTDTYVAQSFTVSQTGVISQVDLKLKRNVTGGIDYSLEIWDESGGSPNAKVSDTVTIDSSEISDVAATWYEYSFTTKPSFTNGEVGYIIWYRSPGDNVNYLESAYSNGSDYAGGTFLRGDNIGDLSAIGAQYDLNFKQYYEASGGWSGGSVNGVEPGSIGSVNGVAIADISSVNGVE